MSTEPTLAPCPFCGGAVMFRKALWPSDGCTDAIIHAAPTECGLTQFDLGTTDEGAIAAWNRRAGGEREQQLEAALKKIEGGFIDTNCLLGQQPPDWRCAFDQLQSIARAALAGQTND